LRKEGESPHLPQFLIHWEVVLGSKSRPSPADRHPRWPGKLTGKQIRVEHWVVAQRQPQLAAATFSASAKLLRRCHSCGARTEAMIAYVGHAKQWDRLDIERDAAAA
jgi:hypothetical protein